MPVSLDPHRQTLQTQFSDRTDIGRLEIGIGQVGLRKPRQKSSDRNRDRGPAQDIADAVVRADCKRHDPPGLAVDVKAQWIRKHRRIVIGGKRRWSHDHPLLYRSTADLRVLRRDPCECEVAVARNPEAFLDRIRNQRGVGDHLVERLLMGINRVERAAGRSACCRDRAEQAEDHAEELFVAELIAAVARVDEVGEKIGSQARAALCYDLVGKITGALCGHLDLWRIRLARLDRRRNRQDLLIVEKYLSALLVKAHHRRDERGDHELRAVLLHPVERRARSLDIVEHLLDGLGNVRFQLLHTPGGECRQEQAPKPRMLLAVHLRHELRADELVVLLVAGSLGKLRCKSLCVEKHLIYFGVTTDDHLRWSRLDDIERRILRPLGYQLVGIFSECRAGEIQIDDLAGVRDFRKCGRHHGHPDRHAIGSI